MIVSLPVPPDRPLAPASPVKVSLKVDPMTFSTSVMLSPAASPPVLVLVSRLIDTATVEAV